MPSLDDIRVVVAERGLVEGPRLAPDGSAWFSDVTQGGVYRVDPSGVVHLELPKRRGIGGLVPHADGGFVVTGRTLLHRTASGEDRMLLARDDVTGFNDLTTLPDGSLIVGALRDPPPGLVLHVHAPGEATVISESLLWPNGIAVGADGGILAADFTRGHVVRLDGEERVHCQAPRGTCDGLALDAHGGLWVALGHGGAIARFTPDGSLDEIFDLPAEFVSSVALRDNDALIATLGTLLRARTSVAGAAVAPARL